MMNYTAWVYLFYLPMSAALTVWVARTLHRNGRVFLVAAFRQDEKLADSVNHLLVVGFYLINLGWVTLAIRTAAHADNPTQVIEAVAVKLGGVMLVLGAMHFLNIYIFNRMRKAAQLDQAPPPVEPDQVVTA